MEKDLHGEGGLVWRRWTCMEKVDLHGEGGLVWRRWTCMEKVDLCPLSIGCQYLEFRISGCQHAARALQTQGLVKKVDVGPRWIGRQCPRYLASRSNSSTSHPPNKQDVVMNVHFCLVCNGR